MAMSPTEMLESEHGYIQKVVAAAMAMADRLAEGVALEADMLQSIVEFMRTYADKFHHGKEENILFPALARKGVPMRGCPVEALMREHQMGRTLVTGLAEAIDLYGKGDAASRDALIKSLRGMVELYPNHIWKEDFLLFPMTNKVLSPEDQANLRQEFEQFEERLQQETHCDFEHFAENLAQKLQGV
jgi:hemerythrin-like domain-containing protein